MQTPSPPLRSDAEADPFDSLAPGPMLPLPPGVYTLLPLAEQGDNLELPNERNWDARTCRRRWDDHLALRAVPAKKEGNSTAAAAAAAYSDSALADDDDEEEEENAEDEIARLSQAPEKGDDEFLTPLFVALPPSPPSSAGGASSGSGAAPAPPVRRRSSAASQRAGFAPMTPMATPSLRPSSPTPAGPSPFAAAGPSRAAQFEALASQPIGFLRPAVVRALIDDNRRLVSMNCRPVWSFLPPIAFPPPPPKTPERRRSSVARSRSASVKLTRTQSFYEDDAHSQQQQQRAAQGLNLEDVLEGLKAMNVKGASSAAGSGGPWAVAFEDWVNEEGPEARREHVDRIVRGWKAKGLFPECLGGWRDEEYVVYAPAPARNVPATFRGPQEGDPNPLPGSNEAFRMERSACGLFGVTTFGVHCTAYVEEDDKPLRIWVPRRSANKQTWPSMLDNTVAGGITAGDLPRMSILRECAEEASLDPEFVARRIRQTGSITYNYRTKEGWLQPEVQYCFDLRLPDPESEKTGDREGVVPTTNPADGEVESFALMTVEEVVQRLLAGEFKPNCALVLLDFFVRHGYLNAESDTRFLDILRHLHRPMALPGPA
ncbi:hypothetical protein JCM8202_000434 [Rhodotorula sphaerocarpa]